MELILDYHLLLDRGLVRDRTEDRCGAFVSADVSLRRARERLFVLADGMGGHPAGDVAAEIAVQSIQEAYFRGGSDDPADELCGAFHAANEAILDAAREDGRRRMGAAAVAAAIVEDRLVVAHLGSCRGYLVRDGRATRLTTDHSWAQGLVDIGCMPAENLRVHPFRKVLTRSLGADPRVDPPVTGETLAVRDTVLLCSDGLWSVVEDGEIARIVSDMPAAAAAAHALLDLALMRGGPDDIAMIVVRVAGVDADSPAVRVVPRPSRCHTTHARRLGPPQALPPASRPAAQEAS